jgi:hypothetical protein
MASSDELISAGVTWINRIPYGIISSRMTVFVFYACTGCALDVVYRFLRHHLILSLRDVLVLFMECYSSKKFVSGEFFRIVFLLKLIFGVVLLSYLNSASLYLGTPWFLLWSFREQMFFVFKTKLGKPRIF